MDLIEGQIVQTMTRKMEEIYPKKDDMYSNTLIKSKTDCSNVPGMDNQLQKKTKVIEEGIKDVNDLTKPEVISEYMIEYLKKSIYVIFKIILTPIDLLSREKMITILFLERFPKKTDAYKGYLAWRRGNNKKKNFTELTYLKKMELMGLNEDAVQSVINERLKPLIINVLKQLSNKGKRKEYAEQLENYEVQLENYVKQKLHDADFSGPSPIEPMFNHGIEEELNLVVKSAEAEAEADADNEETVWRDVVPVFGSEIIKPITIPYSIPLKSKYIIHPVELLNNLTDEDSEPVDEMCREYKESFYTPKNLKETNGRYLGKKLYVDTKKLELAHHDEEEIQCCYKDLYLLENGKKIVDIKLKQIKLIEKYANDKIKSDIEEFDRTKINTDSLLLVELREKLDKCPFMAKNGVIFKDFLDRSFIKFNEIISILDKIDNASLKTKMKELLTNNLIELSVTAERYSLLNTFNIYQLIENETNSCKSRTNTGLRHQLHLFALKKRFQNHIQSLKKVVAPRRGTVTEWATTTTTMAEHLNEFIDAISTMKFCVPKLKIGVNIKEDDVVDFIRRTRNIGRETDRLKRGLGSVIIAELSRLKGFEDDALFNELNGGEPLLDVNNWLDKLKKLVENPSLESITTILTTFCVPDMLINDNVPLEIFLNELFEVSIDFMNNSMNYFTNRYSKHDAFIIKFENLARDLLPSISLTSLALSKGTTAAFTELSVHNVGMFSFNTANAIGGFTGISALIELFMKLIIHFIINIIKETEGGTTVLSTVFSTLLSSTLESVKDVIVRRMTNTYNVILSLTNGKFIYNTLNTVDSILKSGYKTIMTDPELLAIKNIYPLTGFGIQQLEFKYTIYVNTQTQLRTGLINAAAGIGIGALLQQRYPDVLLKVIEELKKKKATSIGFDEICLLIKEINKVEKNSFLKAFEATCYAKQGTYAGFSAVASWVHYVKTATTSVVTAQLIDDTIPKDGRITLFAHAFASIEEFVNPRLVEIGGGSRRTRKVKTKMKNRRIRKTKSRK